MDASGDDDGGRGLDARLVVGSASSAPQSFVALAPGRYHVAVTGNDGDTGSYVIGLTQTMPDAVAMGDSPLDVSVALVGVQGFDVLG